MSTAGDQESLLLVSLEPKDNNKAELMRKKMEIRQKALADKREKDRREREEKKKKKAQDTQQLIDPPQQTPTVQEKQDNKGVLEQEEEPEQEGAIEVPKVEYDLSNLDNINPFAPGGGGIDSLPVGKMGGTGGYDLSQFDDAAMGEVPAEESDEDLKKGHLKVRISKSNHKARLFAFEELEQIAKENPNHEIFGQISDKVPKIIGEKNPMALEQALKYLSVYIKNGGTEFEVSKCIDPLIDNCFSQKREQIVDYAAEIIIELFKKDKDSTVSKINSNITQKAPKKPIAAILAVTKIADALGSQKLDNFNLFTNAVVKAAKSTNPKIKAAAVDYFKMCIDWLGKVYLTILGDIGNKHLLTDLNQYATENPNPKKTLKKKKKDAEGSEDDQEEQQAIPSNLDAYDIIPEYDIFKEFNDSWCDKVVEQPKWNVKKDMLNEFIKKSQSKPKFANTSCSHIFLMTKKLLMDSNQMVQACCIEIIGIVANGLRKNFREYSKSQAFVLIQKLKEKKSMATLALKALNNFFHCMGVEEVYDDAKEAIENKNADWAINTLQWILDYVERKPDKAKLVGSKYMKLLVKMADSGNPKVRDQATKCVVYINGHVGDDTFQKTIKQIPATRQKKIDQFEEEFMKEHNTAKAPEPEVEKVSAPQSKMKKIEEARPKINDKPSEKPKVRTDPQKSDNLASNPRTVAPTLFSDDEDDAEEQVSRSTTKKKNSSNSLSKTDRLPPPSISLDDAYDKFYEIGFSQDIIDNLNHKGWETKLTGLKGLYQWLAQDQSHMKYSQEALLLLRSATKDFKESHAKVNKGIFKLLMKMSENISDKKYLFTQYNIGILLDFVVKRMNDKGFTEAIKELMIRFFSECSPPSIIASFLDIIDKTTINHKMAAELLEFFARIMPLLTPKYLPFGDLLSFSKNLLSSKSASERKIGTEIICNYYSMLGDEIKDYLSDVNPSVVKTIESEFSKRSVDTTVSPTIEILGAKPKGAPPITNSSNTMQTSPNKKGIRATMQPKVSGPAKIDIKQNLATLIKTCKGQRDWQIRKKAFEDSIEVIKESNYNIKTNNIDALIYEIIGIGDDNHGGVLKFALVFLGELCKGLGPDFRQFSKLFLDLFTKHIQSKNQQIKQETVTVISGMYSYVDCDVVLGHMLTNLDIGSDDAKIELLKFLVENQADLKSSDLKHPGVPDLLCKMIVYKNSEVRKLVEELLTHVVQFAGDEMFRTASIKFKPAKKKEINDLLDRLGNASAKEVLHDDDSQDDHHQISSKVSSIQTSSRRIAIGSRPYSRKQSEEAIRPPKPVHHISEARIQVDRQPRNVRLTQVWTLDGPNDAQLGLFKNTLPAYLNESLASKMMSVEVLKVENGLSDLISILDARPQEFLDVVDLIIQSIWIRSYELRPSISSLIVQFLTAVLQKLYGNQVFSQPECEYLVAATIQLRLNCSLYIPREIEALEKLTLVTAGEKIFVKVIMWNATQSQVLLNFHPSIILDLLDLVCSSGGGTSLLRQDYLAIIEALCYKEDGTSQEYKMKGVNLVKRLYTLNPQMVEACCSTRDTQLIQAVQHFLQKDGIQISTVPLPSDPITNESNLQIVEPNEQFDDEEHDIEMDDDIDDEEEQPFSDDEESIVVQEPPKTISKGPLGQLETFIANFENIADSQKITYLSMLKNWMNDPKMIKFIGIKADEIITCIIHFMQYFSSEGVSYENAQLYSLEFDILDKFADNSEITHNVTENPAFDLFDTLLLLLLGASEMKAELVQYDKNGEEFKFITQMIDTMNRLANNFVKSVHPEVLFGVLVELLIKSQTQEVSAKFQILVIKLLIKHTKHAASYVNLVDFGAILLRMGTYITEVPREEGVKDLGIQAIRTVVQLIHKTTGRAVLEKALNTLNQDPDADPMLKRWVESTIQPEVGQKSYYQPQMRKQTNGSPRQMHNQSAHQISVSSHNEGNIAMKAIVSRFNPADVRSFPKYIQDLFQVSLKYPNEDVSSHLKSFSSNHVKYIMRELQRLQERENQQPDQFYSSIKNERSSIYDTTSKGQRSSLNSQYFSNTERKIDPQDSQMADKIEGIRAKMQSFLKKK